MRIPRPSHEVYGINVIPMIDTMMFLLVFFLMASRFADIERDVRVKPPASRDARPITALPQEIVINVTRGGDFLIGGNRRNITDIDALLARAVKANPGQSVVIRGDGHAILQYAVNVLNLCEKHGIQHAYLTTRQDEA
jgi:biopolymer transport protein ExbD